MAQHAPFSKTNKVLLALIIPAMMAYSTQSTAQDTNEPGVTLDTLNVTVNAKPREKVGEEITTRRELDEQNIQNAHDLVRYNTEVDVAEVGRYGNKGFAIRGVDGNRVAMNIDGVALPEIESNELFSPYGDIYEGRFNPDVEMMGSVSVTAGADSIASGSGVWVALSPIKPKSLPVWLQVMVI
ncbi:TonB-dependent receptor plug domain-containing protein [Moraxella ovis]|uniref:TonB-dependent receptor plug domain-containing protein n=1 Tax=Moraxella ovis TaxID=29433 RepID=UPI000D8ABC40|nr:TonB-dependent receptor plug domain-containing protein [Moraxella ovis]SPX84949.1 Probable hemoglobin and hemoglobin-haptoglobin-binding protein 2 precursor [Moraxella ovis]STZ05352.1 Probable hemoglobin and hemoglobin-haptoglobin-binding protein 2 precursor [Moraxella ovis]